MIKLSEKLLAAVDWHALALNLSPKCGDCYATHKGSLKVSAFEIKCYKASDGLAALDVEDIERFFRGCPNCDAPSDCRHCNQVANAAEGQRTAIKLESEV
ncbi:hypothetical protein H6F86_12495 [Phormidium sp. FACHB-592]|uniref:HNH endonuclease n=1 Tax=Stenomitos frigidus AS-A4 TaxID=2933935 RepID=A0ABV0KIV1_9CYAN|nr:hypothetical protein [Phormidium sp. FACHB-592]MBD2074692.1 hypothetical protein [Phormidium sp. FACHB-592]